jgi:thiol-disulfide isomerase/thioredoxin
MIDSEAIVRMIAASVATPTGGAGFAVRAAGVVILLATASTGWVLARRRAGQFRHLPRGVDSGSPVVTGADLRRELGTAATFVQFAAATCATCPQVFRLLADIASTEPGVVHVEIGSEERMDLVRRFSVFRTPTVLLLDRDGAVHSRMSGALTRENATTALAGLTPSSRRIVHV